MVEAVAALLKPKLEEFINSVEEIEAVEGWQWNEAMQGKIHNTRELLTFLNGDWKENLVTRNGYLSMEEVRRQQVALVGGKKVMERIEMNLKRKVVDPFFLKEQLELSRFRIKFFWAFFPWQAQLYDVFGTRGFLPVEILVEERFGWWQCKGAGYIWHPEYAIVGKHFHRVVRTAFHMTDTEVNFDDLEDDEKDFGDSDDELDFDDLEDEDMDYIGEGTDYYTRFDLLFVHREVENEIHKLKVDSTTYADEHADYVGNSFGFLKEVVWALHKPGPPPLRELAAKAIHLHFPKATMKQQLPIPLVEYLLSGPKPKYSQLSLRGQKIWNALVQEEDERLKDEREELERMEQNRREQEEIDWLEERDEEEEMQVQEQLEFEEDELDSKIDNCQYFDEMLALETELEQDEIDQLEQRDREMERQLDLEEEELDRIVDYHQNFHEMVALEAELQEEEMGQLEQRERGREKEIEMERQMDLEQEELDRTIDEYQNFHEMVGLEAELEEEEIDQLEQREIDREIEMEMERQMELEQKELDRIIDDYQNFHELAELEEIVQL